MAASIGITVVAKSAAVLLTSEKSRKTIGWILVVILSPIILIIAVVAGFFSGAANHNTSLVNLCFRGGNIPPSTPALYAQNIESTRQDFAELDDAFGDINAMAEDGQVNVLRAKSIYFSLFFGIGANVDAQAFADCFVTYEERTREVEAPNPDYDASDTDNSEPPTITVTESYTVAVPVKSLPAIYQNIAAILGVRATFEQMTYAQEIYYKVAYDGMPPEGAEFIAGLIDPDAPFVGADGFASPVGSGWQAMFSSPFGGREDPITGEWDDHRGIDLTAAEGHPIYAALDGTVALVWTGGGSTYGHYLVIDHGGGFVTLYAHNSAILVTEGQAVTAGQHIAAMGSTGRVTGPHLHFEIMVGGVLRDPRPYLPS